ncbi:hypothetical protein G6R40_06965 [Chryseobacterium sp. POL2]|uniref:hypothetical protein n=1 Tax=Chryseobacterium sp. POL2 TaxID=2713414 RepID=UPI0013E1D1FC|nr:hypothetical protein [Chryseobacterium sp. POL2]QIG89426.1 hypothetical protein G6R40_06965 [Chryseobacterium sp. POL2]
MKKMILAMALMLSGFAFSQYYQDTYPDYYGYEYYDNQYSYPDDYYYNYPSDYYPDAYYQNYYNDYTNSISGVNWNRFFNTYRLAPWQVQAIINLNNRFPSYMAWSAYYGMNPDRWYYDRFYELERILGPRVFVTYKKKYYKGVSPIVYFQNYRTTYYVVHYHVRPKYKNVNINKYYVDRSNFNDSWKSTRNVAMLDTKSNTIRSNNDGVRNQNMIYDNDNRSGIRNTNGNSRNQSMIETANPNSNIRNNEVRNIRNSSDNSNRDLKESSVRNTRDVRSNGSEIRKNSRNSTPSSMKSSGNRGSQRNNVDGLRSTKSTSRGR